MKKLFSIMMVLFLALSMGINVLAEDDPTPTPTGSITITNATKGDIYTLYKIFDASYSTDAEGNADGVSYSIDETRLVDGNPQPNEVFVALFGTDGKQANPYFEYDADLDGAVKRKDNTDRKDVIQYLSDLVKSNSIPAYVDPVTADSETLVFDNLPYGYYIIDKGNDTNVTITSNTPHVNVIDKNQKPAGGETFKKSVWDEDTQQWVQSSSANIGDIITYKIEFEATNYDGEQQIKYYTMNDTKGKAIWVEFDSVQVILKDPTTGTVIKELNQGYYHGIEGTSNTGEWKYFYGADENKTCWSDADKLTPGTTAEWFMVHRGYHNFDIIIPWMSEYTFTGTTNDFTLTFGDNAESLYDSPIKVEITYTASIGPDATIGGQTTGSELWNQADLSWFTDTTDGPEDPSIVYSTVYALGLTKIDADTRENLAGAEFEIYRDIECTDPVFVIPTNVKGVYILDDLDTIVSGEHRNTSRKEYKDYLDAYLQGERQKNVVTTEANGKVVIIGLELGEYYLKETKAPNGYNKLNSVATISVTTATHPFYMVTDATGNIVNSETATDGQIKNTYYVSSTVVENSVGVELPSTGGQGTMMLIGFGSMIALVFAVLLITHKKMTIYQD